VAARAGSGEALHYTGTQVSAQEDVLDGRYRILERIGRGGMGEVFRAERVRLGDDVAIKFVRTDAAVTDDLRARFMAEGRNLAALRHPNIVSVLDFGVDERRGPFLVMEHLSGPSLAAEIAASGPLDVNKAVRITTDLAAALDLAHNAGLVHRDVKPANVVAHRYSNGELSYKIVDFGIGTVIRKAGSTTTAPRQMFASLPYAAPEQLVGDEVDHHADVYGLGALAFEMLTGRPPFQADGASELFSKVMFGEVPCPSTLRATLDARIDQAVLTALERDVERRWQSATAFANALAGTQTHNDDAAARPSPSGLLERYELSERIDTGRLGSEVYAGRHRAIGSSVAIRVLRRSAAPGWAAARARFLREAQAMQVSHPSILQVRDYGEEPDLVYIVTDRVGGYFIAAVDR
jgi:serine/threonine protein kinase